LRRLTLKFELTSFFCNTDNSIKRKMNRGHQTFLSSVSFHIISEFNSIAISYKQSSSIIANPLSNIVHLKLGIDVQWSYLIQVYKIQIVLPYSEEVFILKYM
jgi:hypothetical protein